MILSGAKHPMDSRPRQAEEIETPSVAPVLERIEDAIAELQKTDRNQLAASPSAPTRPSLSVVIPVFNERRTVEEVIARVSALDIDKQVILVDDGSTDGTREILASYMNRKGFDVVLHPCNRGKGAALQSGFQHACGKVVIVQDADLEYDPQDILRVIGPILEGDSDVVYGSRYLRNNHQDPSLIHRLGNWILTQFSNCMTANRLTDMETCYKAIRGDVLKTIHIEQKRFGFEPEITAKLSRRGYRILEVPISYRSRSWKEGKKIGWRDLVNTLWCIVRYRFN